MRYEVYGIYNEDGVNYFSAWARSMKKAIELTKKVSQSCRYWAILEKEREHSIPYGITVGERNGPPIRTTMLVEPSKRFGNPILHEEDGKRYWKDIWTSERKD